MSTKSTVKAKGESRVCIDPSVASSGIAGWMTDWNVLRREAFVELQSPQAATALKRRIESFGNGQTYAKKATAIYVRPDFNPFKTYPKDAPARNKDGFKDRGAPGAYNNGNPNFNQHGGGFRGGRGNFNNNNSRGGMGGMNNVNTGGFGGQGRGGFQNTQMGMMGYGAGAGGMGGNFGNQMMGGFGNQMGFNRGGAGMMNMRGGFNNRGRGNMMGGNMMPNMAMGAMGMPMNAMGMGMQGQCYSSITDNGQAWLADQVPL